MPGYLAASKVNYAEKTCQCEHTKPLSIKFLQPIQLMTPYYPLIYQDKLAQGTQDTSRFKRGHHQNSHLPGYTARGQLLELYEGDFTF